MEETNRGGQAHGETVGMRGGREQLGMFPIVETPMSLSLLPKQNSNGVLAPESSAGTFAYTFFRDIGHGIDEISHHDHSRSMRTLSS